MDRRGGGGAERGRRQARQGRVEGGARGEFARVPGQDHDGSQGQVAQLGEKGGEGEGPRGSGGNRQRRGGGSGFLVS